SDGCPVRDARPDELSNHPACRASTVGLQSDPEPPAAIWREFQRSGRSVLIAGLLSTDLQASAIFQQDIEDLRSLLTSQDKDNKSLELRFYDTPGLKVSS